MPFRLRWPYISFLSYMPLSSVLLHLLHLLFIPCGESGFRICDIEVSE